MLAFGSTFATAQITTPPEAVAGHQSIAQLLGLFQVQQLRLLVPDKPVNPVPYYIGGGKVAGSIQHPRPPYIEDVGKRYVKVDPWLRGGLFATIGKRE